MPEHIKRLLFLLLLFLVIAYGGIVLLTDPSFYRFGHYRADVVPELATGEIGFRGPDYCSNCHVDRHELWSSSVHERVSCEVCHGPAGAHPESGKLPVPQDTVKLCVTCHEAMPSRPAAHPQIDVSAHPFPHETPVVCTTCHNPHSPGIGNPETVVQLPEETGAPDDADETTKDGEEVLAGAAPKSAAGCAACHGSLGQGVGTFPVLAGMDFYQFVEVMNQFKTGEKPSPMMGALAKALSDAEIRELANYYAGLPGSEE